MRAKQQIWLATVPNIKCFFQNFAGGGYIIRPQQVSRLICPVRRRDPRPPIRASFARTEARGVPCGPRLPFLSIFQGSGRGFVAVGRPRLVMADCERRAGGGRLRTGHGPRPTFLFAAKGTVTYTNEIVYSILSGERSLISDLPEGFALHKQKGQLSSAETPMALQTKNLFLSSLSPASRELLVSRSTAVALPQKMRLYKPERRPTYGYLLTSGIASVSRRCRTGRAPRWQ